MQPQARFIPRKLLLVMKLTVFLITIIFLQVSATAFSQKINLKEKNVSIDKVLNQIQDQSGYEFFYNASLLKQAGNVSISLKDASVQDALDQLFRDKPFTYTLDNNTITIKQKETSLFDNLKKKIKEAMAAMDVSGRVTDENNQPLSGATITEKGTNNVTTSDVNGFFTLKQVQPNATIMVTFIGFDKKELPAAVNLGAIKLSPTTNPLDEIKIIAYGQTTQRLSVGNVSSVSAKDIANQPVSSPLQALEGRVPGLFITQTNGIAGGGITVRMQGQNSMTKGNDPLYVIDGVPYVSQMLPTTNVGLVLGGSSGIGSGNGNPLNYINPNDIESISVLKDADATAIYGSRAANGAILITTKKGEVGPTKVSMDLQQGWGQVTRQLGLMNTQQYLQMRKDALTNDGLPLPSFATNPNNTDYDINGFWDPTRYTDWQKVLIGNTAHYTNVNGSISGGNATTQYLVGGTFHRETSVFPGDFADQKGSLHFNLNSASLNQKLKMSFSGTYLVDKNRLPNTDLTATALALAPDAPALYNPDGSLNWALKPNGAATFGNPLRNLLQTYQNKTNNLISNLTLSYQILKDLDIKTSLGYNNLQTDEIVISPLTAQSPANQAALGPNGRSSSFSYSTFNSWIIEPQLNYHRNLGKGKLDVLFGSTINQLSSRGLDLSGFGYNTDASISDIHSATNVSAPASIASTYKYAALFGRVNYNWLDKYIIDITARRDGSSRFGPANQFHDFWSAGAGWIFSEESFIKNKMPFLSFGKLRGSYGTTGNDQIGDYTFMNLYNPTSAGVPYQGATGLATNSLPNPYIQWEETHKLQAGIDLGFLKDRILLTANYVNNRSSNQLSRTPLPSISGFTSIPANVDGTVQNTAWEFTISTTNLKSEGFSWVSNFNLTILQNKLTAYPANGQGYNSVYFIGQSLATRKYFHYLGVDPSTGLYLFQDSHGNPTSNPNPATDQNSLVDLGNFPKYYGGFQNTIHYKGFQLDFLFQFVKQIKPNLLFGQGLPPGSYNNNQPVWVLDRWQKSGDIAALQKYNSNFGLFTQWSDALSSDAGYSDASYIRLKNLSLSYSFPAKWLQNARFQNLMVFTQGQNLLTITKFKGMDPETGSGGLPPLKVLTVGLRAAF